MLKKISWLVILVFSVSGCAAARHAVPADLFDSATVSGMRDVRAVSGSPSDSFTKDFVGLLERAKESGPSFFDFKTDRTYTMLAISGGAAYGAYGAGLLNGWTQEGSRPVFQIVTGISVGAIIAPFAFLGSAYDRQLEELCTNYATKDIMHVRLSHNSFASSRPLERLLERYFDESLLKEIAAAYARGRRLYVGTTDLDAQRLIIWDMGKIASIGDERALRLFRKVILASASIPLAFPPVYLQVEVGNKRYDEMHVDGGVVKQVFFLHDIARGLEQAARQKGVDMSRLKYRIYVIRNGYVDAVWQEVPDRLVGIAERALDTLINAQGVGDIYQLYTFTKLRGADFNLAYIPGAHLSRAKEPFDPVEMRELFNLGFQEALGGYHWKKVPPGLDEE
jgi:hypothetical protein